MDENQNITEQIQPESTKENETKAEKFTRIAETRVEKAISAISNLENLSNTSNYEYTQDLVDQMFGAIESRLAEVKAKFQPKNEEEKKPFKFGIQ